MVKAWYIYYIMNHLNHPKIQLSLSLLLLAAYIFIFIGCQNWLQTLSQTNSDSERDEKSEKLASPKKLSLDLPPGVSLSPNTVRLYKQTFHIFETRYFKIFFAENDVQKAVEVTKASDEGYQELASWFKQELYIPYEIYLMPDKSSFQRATGGSMYGAAGAVTNRGGTLYLLSDYVNIPTLTHEMAHVFLSKKVRGREVPIWFNEGLAEYMAYLPQLKSGSLRALTYSRVKNLPKVYSLQEMERNGMMRDSEATYTQALSLILFLDERYGKDKLNQLLDLYGQPDFHQPFGGAVSRVYGKSRNDLEQEWLEFIGIIAK